MTNDKSRHLSFASGGQGAPCDWAVRYEQRCSRLHHPWWCGVCGAAGIEKIKIHLTKVIGQDGRIRPARPAAGGGVSAGWTMSCGDDLAILCQKSPEKSAPKRPAAGISRVADWGNDGRRAERSVGYPRAGWSAFFAGIHAACVAGAVRGWSWGGSAMTMRLRPSCLAR